MVADNGKQPIWKQAIEVPFEDYVFVFRMPLVTERERLQDLYAAAQQDAIPREARESAWCELFGELLTGVKWKTSGKPIEDWHSVVQASIFTEVIAAAVDAVFFRGKLTRAQRDAGLGGPGQGSGVRAETESGGNPGGHEAL